MGSQCRSVVCNSVFTIVPKYQAPTTTYFLSNFDLAFASQTAYMLGVYYFRTKKDDPKTPSIQSLKDSLSEILSIYPVFAGRLKKGEQGRLEVDVNGEGVPFIEATTEANLDDWPDLHLCDIEHELNPKDHLVHDMFTAPLFRVQFTSFRCGGVALGFSSLHIITDGLAAIEFLKAWGELHRGVQISTSPQFDSIRIQARHPPRVTVASADELFCAGKPLCDWFESSNTVGKSLRCKNLFLSIERPMIDECIEAVETGPFSYGKASSFEALSALLWAAVTRARGLEDNALTSYYIPVSVRDRLHPPLSKGYFGNGVFLTKVTANASDMKSKHHSFAASLIHKRLQMLDQEFIHSAIDWMELRQQQYHEVGMGIDITTGSNVSSTSWANIPVYEIDFGWRRLDHFEFSVWNTLSGDGLFFFLPPSPSANKQSRRMKLCLREDHMERLIHDHQIRLYFRDYNQVHL